MQARIYILPYKQGSGSVKKLHELLDFRTLLHNSGKYHFLKNHVVVNWGYSKPPYWGVSTPPNTRILNHWTLVPFAVNKISTFKKLSDKGVPTPDWTTNRAVAKEWASNSVVFCRKLVSSQEGAGIVIATSPSEVVDAPLYTRLFAKEKEYRVHVFDGKVIDYSIKKLTTEGKTIANRCKYIRNLENGWVFSHNIPAGRELTKAAANAAINSVEAVGLNFGAVDLAIGTKGHVAVFEINTAPGIEGKTLEAYRNAITAYVKKI